MDIKSPEERSKNMAAIRSKNTKPEIYFRKLLFAQGYRYSLNSKKVPGHPDIYLRKYNTAIFIHGCFWHRHSGCQYAYMPKSRVEFWQKKFKANVNRDNVVRMELQDKGIKCLIVWECTVKKMKRNQADCERYMQIAEKFLKENQVFLEI
ncbi:very short patch repair endonuclease [Extibacter muris]|uniref:Very short patch repair endonuclease n=1 Tax=Extibacter muris TaxID=1796622 RepID=A0A4R4FFE7_9FIRM|nr:very short patch repair endonuclease [Extibacter muris]MCU0080329.1 very short patch repair endonuclease [Extibacter muris]TDA21436.1 DNA mismatch endonuclease Vsr [Extibacter muris]